MGVEEILKYRGGIVMWKILSNFFSITKRREDKYFKDKITSLKNEDIRMDTVMENLFRSKKLYDILKVKCHPDKFVDISQKEKATKIYQNITECKTDYQFLLEIKKCAEKQLKITF